ncbi:polysaccharide deacetylase family protein [Clostridium tarantellae]|uniref:Polysaccharide deacetylase family protein n=1 Tax=Clostridium tarantellae TaxID=39493 RepID=A0A6I1MMH4_9CLOT|nr:polysaccharide deacetylase family protein [Clostridium tarantellae]MPQ43442.1 polysaccharide deacetylase family protein [Clostridium tarantellae]
MSDKNKKDKPGKIYSDNNFKVSNKKIGRRRSRRRKEGIKIGIAVLGIIALLVIGTKVIFNSRSVTDASDEKENVVKMEGKKETPKPKPDDIIPNSNVTYEGDKYAVNAVDVKTMLEGKYPGEDKIVFLTFDDGPSPNTDKVLNTLSEKGVHGTFFMLGERIAESDEAKERVKKVIKNGNAIANHSYTHNMKKLYPHNKVDVQTFMNEYHQTNDLLKSVLGDEFNATVVRMPGGYNSRQYYKDPNLPALNEAFDKEGIVSIDWNALDGDAEGKPYTNEQMMNYVKSSSKGLHKVIILMHDTYGKEKTAEILPQIIDYFKEQGYEFKTIKNADNDTPADVSATNNKEQANTK